MWNFDQTLPSTDRFGWFSSRHSSIWVRWTKETRKTSTKYQKSASSDERKSWKAHRNRSLHIVELKINWISKCWQIFRGKGRDWSWRDGFGWEVKVCVPLSEEFRYALQSLLQEVTKNWISWISTIPKLQFQVDCTSWLHWLCLGCILFTRVSWHCPINLSQVRMQISRSSHGLGHVNSLPHCPSHDSSV